MNIEKHLILVKNEDKTEQIEFCKYVNGKWRVIYYNNSTDYNYSFNNVVWHTDPKILNYETSVVYEDNQPLSGIIRILDFNDYFRIIFKTGYKKIYRRSSIIIEETCLTNKNAHNCFEYLKKLADQTSVKDDADISFLSKQYNRLTTISPRSVLAILRIKTNESGEENKLRKRLADILKLEHQAVL